jgi:hypothetical protein
MTLSYVTPLDHFTKLVDSIQAIESNIGMVRIGGSEDGSYFIPTDFDGIKCLISPGVGTTWKFEKQLWDDFSIPSIMVDGSVSQPLEIPSSFVFLNKFLSVVETRDSVTLERLVELAFATHGNGDLMLQMDIEGGEIDTLKYVTKETLMHFRIIVIEFHYLDLWETNEYFQQYVLPIFNKLLDLYCVVSLNSNNHGRNFEIHKRFIPSAIEMTFLRKDRLDHSSIREGLFADRHLGGRGKLPRAFDIQGWCSCRSGG